MINLQLRYNIGFKWHSSKGVYVKGYAYIENNLLKEEDLAKHFQNISNEYQFKDALLQLNGLFSVIVLYKDKLIASVDKLRTFPLLYSNISENNFSISDDYRSLSPFTYKINSDAKNTMLSFGYVLGRDTLIENIFQLQAGEYLIFQNNSLSIKQWYKPAIPAKTNSGKSEWKAKLKDCLLDLGKRLSSYVQDRPVALPLSGGFDSRLIGLLLKINGHTNTLCFTYGKESNNEAILSKVISKRLNFPWLFIDYRPYIGKDYIHSNEFKEYIKFIGNGITFPYIQEYFAACSLKENYKLSSDTIFIPGHSGDMIGGSHLLPDMEKFNSTNDLIKKILRKNPSLCHLSIDEWNSVYNKLVENTSVEYYQYKHSAHDEWNIRERQSKQIINSAKVWDFFGYEYILPLLDYKLTNLLLELPFELRVYKNLYDEVIKELFKENGILLDRELLHTSLTYKRYSYLKMKIKDSIPLLTKVKKANQNDFFYFKELVKPLASEIYNQKPKMLNGVITSWYIQSF